MTQPVPKVINDLLVAGLLTDSEVTVIDNTSNSGDCSFDGRQLLDDMLNNGRLTPFQAEEVAEGRGRQLALGNYLVLSKLGEGGMGTVYKAIHTRMQRVVALKTLKPETSTATFVERFYREVRAAARLNHPNAVAAYDADECEQGHFLVMEYIDGEDLSRIVKRDGPMPMLDVLIAIRQTAEALAYAHRFGIVHRDIKPANLLRDASGTVKVTDLGLARLRGDTDDNSDVGEEASLTQAGTSLGTIDYMAPEQALDAASADARADIYSLGCTLYYLLTGKAVYEEPSLMQRLLAHREGTIPSVSALRPDASPNLDGIFQRMVAKHPDDRFQTMNEVIAELNALPEFRQQKRQSDGAAISELTVFVVEPSSFQSRVIQQYLHEIGIDDVHVYRSARETLDAIVQLRPSIVITSFQLPDGNGIEFLQRLRHDLRWESMPVVLVTSDPLVASQLQFINDRRATTLVEKPFKRADLEAAIRQTLSESCRQSNQIAGLSQLRVMIVDDSSVARRSIEETLIEIGFSRFTHAENGQVAADALAQRNFELVVTDYNMPEMNGYALVEWIRGKSPQPHVPIIMCTTVFDPQKLAEVYQLGVSAICNKSFERDLVRNIIIRLFR